MISEMTLVDYVTLTITNRLYTTYTVGWGVKLYPNCTESINTIQYNKNTL